jgi:very-short-patch-repair endonuclease/DNA-directed RNA polymerase subunit RPC12/RpoP
MDQKLCKCGCGNPVKNIKNTYIVGHSNRSLEVKQKKIQKYIEKYGVDNPSKANSIKIKKEETNLKKFGTKHASQNEDIKNEVKQKWISKYGVDNPSKIDYVKKIISEKVKLSRETIREKTQKTFYKTILKRLHDEGKMGTMQPLFDYNDYNGRNFKYPFICTKCSTKIETNLKIAYDPLRCFTCNPKINTGGQSIIEKDIFEYVKKLDENIKNQDRTIIPPLELDIVSEKHKIAIEIDGLYWHSEISGKKNKFYHSVKRKNTNNCGYKLIQIFEDEWIEKQKIVKSRLKNSFNQNKRKIYARKCIVKELPTEIKSKFLKKYHIQGNDRSNIHLGLFYKNRLVSVMTFNPYRIALGNSAKNNCYELTRFCSILNFSIIGGASKLLKYFEKNYKPTEIISYADKRWSDGNLYNKLGFNLVGTTQPNYWYIVKNQRKHRFAYRKSELQKLLKQYDNNLSEWDNMQLNGYDRIWDCGSLKFQKNY